MLQRPSPLRVRLRAGRMAPLLVFLALFACAAQALDEGPTVPGYYRKVWTTESGAPSYIRAIEQSPEGFLWLGSDTGLYRFDGVEFTRFEPPLDPALPVGPVTALAMEPDGALTRGKYAPSLMDVAPKDIYMAMETGPQSMPVFNDTNLDSTAKRDIIAFLKSVEEGGNPGGLSLGRLGPVTEGMFAWIFGLGLLVGIAVWLGKKAA